MQKVEYPWAQHPGWSQQIGQREKLACGVVAVKAQHTSRGALKQEWP